ncbi:aldolase/citrate lyase family protein [Streptomyces roseifaciens]
MIRKNATLGRIRNGESAVGTWLQLHSVHAARLLVAQGLFQWMLVDFEHTPVDHTTATHIFSAVSDLSSGDVTPLARVAVGSVEQIKHALDAGAQGVVVPMVETAEEAAAAVKYARFPPTGVRGSGGLSPHIGFAVSGPVYRAQVNSEILVAVQIESPAGVENVHDILAVDGIDLVFIGPFDLHLSYGLPSKVWSREPEFVRAVARITEAARAAGVPLGTLTADAAGARERLSEGFTFIGMGSDAHVMLTEAGRQYGDLYGIAEPAETWCNLTNLGRLSQSTIGSAVSEGLPW